MVNGEVEFRKADFGDMGRQREEGFKGLKA